MAIQILGLKQLLSQIENAEKVNLSPVIKREITRVQRTAKDYSPVDTGHLMRSIHIMPLGDYSLGGKVFTSTEYAWYQEFGTSKMMASNNGLGFMRFAMDRNEQIVLKNIANFINTELGKL